VSVWQKLTLELAAQDADRFSDWLWEQEGLLGVQESPVGAALFSPGQDDVLEFGSKAAKRFAKWLQREAYRGQERIWILSFWDSGRTLHPNFLESSPVPATWVSCVELPVEDYAETYRQGVKATELLNGRVWIGPPWLPQPDSEFSFVVEPGLGFGTGEHPTTQLCVESLVHWADQGHKARRILDLGSGSGILSVAVLRLFPEAELWAVDTDPQCEAELLRACQLNSCDVTRLKLCFGSDASWTEQRFDLVVSNIYAEVLSELLPRIAAVLEPGGLWIASGILQGAAEQDLIHKAEACFDELEFETRDRVSPSLDVTRGLAEQREVWVRRTWKRRVG
jgi:ribosomal protein L11 methyltransferase